MSQRPKRANAGAKMYRRARPGASSQPRHTRGAVTSPTHDQSRESDDKIVPASGRSPPATSDREKDIDGHGRTSSSPRQPSVDVEPLAGSPMDTLDSRADDNGEESAGGARPETGPLQAAMLQSADRYQILIKVDKPDLSFYAKKLKLTDALRTKPDLALALSKDSRLRITRTPGGERVIYVSDTLPETGDTPTVLLDQTHHAVEPTSSVQPVIEPRQALVPAGGEPRVSP